MFERKTVICNEVATVARRCANYGKPHILTRFLRSGGRSDVEPGAVEFGYSFGSNCRRVCRSVQGRRSLVRHQPPRRFPRPLRRVEDSDRLRGRRLLF